MEDSGLIKVLAKDFLSLLLKDKSVMERYGFVIEPDVFDNPIHRILFKMGREYFTKYGSLPKADVFQKELEIALREGGGTWIPDGFFWEETQSILNMEPHREYLEDRMGEFIVRRGLLTISEKAKVMALSPDPSLEAIRKEVQKASEGRVGTDLGSFLFKDHASRDRKNIKGVCIPTGLPELDDIMGGGREKGTLGIVMAPTGAGKSAVLITFGANAARARFKVAHVTLELSGPAVCNRYEAGFSNVAKLELWRQETHVVNRLERAKKLLAPADILVKEFPAGSLGMDGLRTWLSNIDFWHKFQPDLLIIDYADIMKLSKGENDDKWVKQGELYTELRGLAQELNVAVWTAVQSKKDALSKPVLHLGDIAGAVEKAQVADCIIAMCRSEEERKARQARFFVAKNRDGIDDKTIFFRENFDISRVSSQSGEVPSTRPIDGGEDDELGITGPGTTTDD